MEEVSGTPSVPGVSDVTEDTFLPGGNFRVRFDAEFDVECEFDYEKGVTFALVQQALQDAIGYTGIEILDVTEYELIP